MHRDEVIWMMEILKQVKEKVDMIKRNPLLLSEEEIDALEFDLKLLNDFLKDLRKSK